MDLTTPVQFVPGVGPRRAAQLGRLDIRMVRDLLWHLPRTWLDRSTVSPLAHLEPGPDRSAAGVIVRTRGRRIGGGRTLLEAEIDDGRGRVRAVWFNQPYLARRLQAGVPVLVTGTVRTQAGELQFVHPELEILPAGGRVGSRQLPIAPAGGRSQDPETEARPHGPALAGRGRRNAEPLSAGRIVPVYALTAGITQAMLRGWIRTALDATLPLVIDPLPEARLRGLGMADLRWALERIHFPEAVEETERARLRLAFDEFLTLQLAFGLVKGRRARPGSARPLASPGRLRNALRTRLPFPLTGGQEQVLAEVLADLGRDVPMNRLLQGDVGSGKTVVAVLACLEAVEAGAQAAYLAPTEILAQQQARLVAEWCAPLGLRTGCLLGRTKAAERRALLGDLIDGTVQIVVGTHALLEDVVRFRDLGLVIVDEQHRFGVLQRARLREKGLLPHTLVMSATPIPRTLSLTLHGDLDVSWLRERPAGRVPPTTRLVEESRRDGMLAWIAERLRKGDRAFFVYPLVEESERLDLRDATRMADTLRAHSAFEGIEVGLLHGRMKGEEKQEAIDRFRDGRTPCLVTTTVVEVGVDIPRATILVVEHAERFGLSQLHQLRGRVGRGGGESHVFLMRPGHEGPSTARLKVLVREHDGFRVAEADLRLRGPGEILGTAQHGLPELKAADLVRDPELLVRARSEAERLLAADPRLAGAANSRLREHVLSRYGERMSLYEVG